MSAIISIGTAVPPYRQDQQAAVELVSSFLNLNPSDKKLLKVLYRFTGIKYRNTVLGDMLKSPGDYEFFPNDPANAFPSTSVRMQVYRDNALILALAAIKECFNQLKQFDPKIITHLITVSCTGMYAPGLDIELVQELGLRTTTKRTAINFMGCYGAFNALKVADAICQADPNATVLMVCVELCSIHLQKKTTLDNMTSNAIFADGASCAIVQGTPCTDKFFALTHFHSDLIPSSNNEMAWHITDSGFDMLLSTYVPQMIGDGIQSFLEKLLEQTDITSDAIDYYAIHPGAQKILKSCEKALNITADKNKYAYQVLENYGNMSSATILFVLKLIWDDIQSQEQHNKTIFSCAFGPGLTLESMLLKTSYV